MLGTSCSENQYPSQRPRTSLTWKWFCLRCDLVLPLSPQILLRTARAAQRLLGLRPFLDADESPTVIPLRELKEVLLVQVPYLRVESIQPVMVLDSLLAVNIQLRRSETHAGNAQMRNEVADGVPEALAAFTIRQAKAFALSGMIKYLARPFVPERVKYRHREREPVYIPGQKSPLPGRPFRLTRYIVQKSHRDVQGQVLEQRFQEQPHIELLFPATMHVD
jgi:hypothetical protein